MTWSGRHPFYVYRPATAIRAEALAKSYLVRTERRRTLRALLLR